MPHCFLVSSKTFWTRTLGFQTTKFNINSACLKDKWILKKNFPYSVKVTYNNRAISFLKFSVIKLSYSPTELKSASKPSNYKAGAYLGFNSIK